MSLGRPNISCFHFPIVQDESQRKKPLGTSFSTRFHAVEFPIGNKRNLWRLAMCTYFR